MAVRPDRQGGGIGSALIREGIDRLIHLGAAGCVLVMEPAHYGRLKYPGIPAEYLQALCFNGKMPTGTVAYHPAFG